MTFRTFSNNIHGRKLTIDKKLESIVEVTEVLNDMTGILTKGILIYDSAMGYSCMGVEKEEVISIIEDKFTDRCEEFYNIINYQSYIGGKSEKHYFDLSKGIFELNKEGILVNTTEILTASIDLYFEKYFWTNFATSLCKYLRFPELLIT